MILNAGYLGSLIWGAVLLVAGARSRHDARILGLLGVVLVIAALFFIRSAFGFLYGLLVGVGLIVAAVKLPDVVSDTLLAIIGSVSCLYAVWDIGSDILFRDIPESDAHLLAEYTGIPVLIWGSAWVLLAFAVSFFALRAASGRLATVRGFGPGAGKSVTS